ncbi:MAG: DUF2948 family protein [Asticcacaulis sp.]|uniref:DUF2948 family protein n=1 Tax=Asticcacaulis sp. TaxID=1872648 RepID=UPI003F7C3961
MFGWGKPSKPLRLIAETPEDVAAVAALVQDAALRAGDLSYDAEARHFTMTMNRFCHEAASGRALRAPSVLRVASVLRVQARGFDPKASAAPLCLLDLAVEALEAPAVALTLRFAGEGAKDVRIEAECVDLTLLDLAAPRRARSAPNHQTD